MSSHELASIIGIIAIWTTLGAFFAGYYFAKRRSKKDVEKLGEKIVKTKSKNHMDDNNENTVNVDDSKNPETKFDWL